METLAKQKEMVVARANEKQEYINKHTVWQEPYSQCGQWAQESVFDRALKCNQEVVAQHQDAIAKWLIDMPVGWMKKINAEDERDVLVMENTIKDIEEHYKDPTKEMVDKLKSEVYSNMASMMVMPFTVKANTIKSSLQENPNAWMVAMLVCVYGEPITRVYDGVFSTKTYKLSTHERTVLDYNVDKLDDGFSDLEYGPNIGWVFRRLGVIKAYEVFDAMLTRLYAKAY